MATLNPRAQIALVLAQMEFFLKDLSTVQNCVSYSNYQTFFNLLKNNADLTKLVMRVGTVSGKNKSQTTTSSGGLLYA